MVAKRFKALDKLEMTQGTEQYVALERKNLGSKYCSSWVMNNVACVEEEVHSAAYSCLSPPFCPSAGSTPAGSHLCEGFRMHCWLTAEVRGRDCLFFSGQTGSQCLC